MVHTSRTPAKHYLVARVLLMSDQNEGASGHTDGQIAEVLSISRRIVIRIKQRFVQENLEVALTGTFLMNVPSVGAWMAREKPNSFIWYVARLPMGGNAGRWNSELPGW
jgi:hypothetical protein